MSPAGDVCCSRIRIYENCAEAHHSRRRLCSLGSKSDPPLPAAQGHVVSAVLNTCSNARNFRMPRLTEGCKRSPPLYADDAAFISMREAAIDLHVALVVEPGNAERITVARSRWMRSRIFLSDTRGWRSNTGFKNRPLHERSGEIPARMGSWFSRG